MVAEFEHVSVLLTEAVDALSIVPEGVYVDGTFGRGGHSRLILEKLGPEGRLLAIDRDQAAEDVAVTEFGRDARFRFYRGSYIEMEQCVALAAVSKVNGVLLDLGVSSPQLDDASRGFSFLKEGPLDMRMDQSSGVTAAQWLASAPEAEIADVLWTYGEEKFSRRMAKAIVERRSVEPILRTTQLATIVADANPRWEKGKHPATRAFQAIRIHINQELDQIPATLERAFGLLAKGGYLVVISFHSLEDRLVKQFMKSKSEPIKAPKGLPVPDDWSSVQGRVVKKKIRASAEELEHNARARSAVMRVLEKTV
ncbi:MAG: 16S rRNA (cytosine(1402)-N(4))-methyltransferase RsmH [Hahellaceae bacterium]|jgi:16S rRNA (cytosine1402-N4)-methyltransferase|nr:16S rRNA (cytosine(1402)-N(4))-methyltransferase RsmH [Hahellaceae bacterium]